MIDKIVSVVYARDINFGIGKNNELPWDIKEDLKNFKNITSSFSKKYINVCVMGKNTYKSIGKPLKNRLNVVLSKTLDSKEQDDHDNLIISRLSLSDTIDILISDNKINNIYIIGGSEIYNEAFKLNQLNCIHETVIHSKYDCDKFINLESDYLNKFKLIVSRNISDNPKSVYSKYIKII